jgi:hypothetical protein
MIVVGNRPPSKAVTGLTARSVTLPSPGRPHPTSPRRVIVGEPFPHAVHIQPPARGSSGRSGVRLRPLHTIPAPWSTVVNHDSRLVVRYPSSWEIFDERPGGVTFVTGQDSWAGYDAIDRPLRYPPGDEAGIEFLTESVMDQLDGEDETRVVRSGLWTRNLTGHFVEMRTRNQWRDLNTHHLVLLAPLGDAHTAVLSLGRIGGRLTTAEQDLASQVMAAMHLTEPNR